MSHIFISYAHKNRDFALTLASDLDRYYDVWIDKEKIDGGLEWENSIDQALKSCGAFVVGVSTDSNSSEWVARETLRAEQLKKHRIPLMIQGELPLRLLNLHYIDFQGEYQGGLRDLLEVLKSIMDPTEKHKGEVDRLIGQAIREYLVGSYPKANSLIGQVLTLDPAVAPTVQEFWTKLGKAPKTNFSQEYLHKIDVIEYARVSEIKYENSATAYEWSLELKASDEIMNLVDFVEYQLHPTFSPQIQIVRARKTNFRLLMVGWGTFEIPIHIHFKDGTVGHTKYELTFELRWRD
jgi:hypothetical protein